MNEFDRATEKTLLASQLVQDMLRIHREEKDMILAKSKEEIESFDRSIQSQIVQIRSRYNNLYEIASDRNKQRLNSFKNLLDQWLMVNDEVRKLKLNWQDGQARVVSVTSGLTKFNEAEREINKMVEAIRNEMLSQKTQSLNGINFAMRLIFRVSLIGTIICVILVSLVTSDISKTLKNAVESLANGSLEMGDRWRKGLVERIKIASAANPKRMEQPAGNQVICPPVIDIPVISTVAISSCACSFQSLLNLLRQLPGDFPVPVLALTYMAGNVSRRLSDWFSKKIKMAAVTARGGEPLHASPGVIFFAPDGKHLKVMQGELVVESGPLRNQRIPSYDVLLDSLAAEMGSETAAVLLAGTGNDGVEGLLKIKSCGGYTICQNRETAAVSENVGFAEARGAAVEYLSTDCIASRLIQLVQ